jgi:alkanesulfonate monooxygenase SsuD/methylene tetrahydromethanopterin reductase-like flavin-dependent oxidoreductase (luciferase family)
LTKQLDPQPADQVRSVGIANISACDSVAMAAAQRTLTEAHPGRFVLGVGVSHAPIVDARGHRHQRPLGTMHAFVNLNSDRCRRQR